MRYADMETTLGEIDDARSLYIYGSQIQMSDPWTDNNFWQTWKNFEVNHGNENTMRDMLRMEAVYIARINSTAQKRTRMETNERISAMDSLDANATGTLGEQQQIKRSAPAIDLVRGATDGGASAEPKVVNPDEIHIDVDDMEVDDDDVLFK